MMEKASALLLLKDVDEVYSRLFNHHPVISGEIKYFLKEFEEQRNDREVEMLFQALEKTIDTRESHLDKAKNNADIHLPSLASDCEIDSALSICNRILESGEKSKVEVGVLSSERESREMVLADFLKDIESKRVQVDETFREKEIEIEEYYRSLEEKMNACSTQR